MAEFSLMESVSFDERRELDQLRDRVRATRRATSGPLLVFGVAITVFAVYDGTVSYAFVPLPLYWPLCTLVALLALTGMDRMRRGRTGVGAGPFSYGKAAVLLAAVVLAGSTVWFFPFTKLLLWPATVLTVLAVRQGNRPLAVRSGIIGTVMIAGWAFDGPVPGGWLHPFVMGAGGVALIVLGLVWRGRERTIA
ncbi:hypothetical protein [Actinoplanes palleronii]|uniref:Uncharacterized protein n=1 Tax=Actinoplanes palleronii TaxID=113570 RepID=A0ABQ4BMH1_9ACTN|nr:hypothetical protein [Actinoplanes palleronii]GIE71885.1 hypothetical protein Apa02nite_079930 [Actinoplanes palleronii]